MALVERYVSTTGAGAHDGTSEANAFSWTEMVTDSATSAAGTRYNIKNDATYSRTTASDSLGGGTSTSPKIYRGYSSAIGDGYQGRTNGNGPLITTNMPVITYTTGRITTIGLNMIIESLNVTSQVTGSSGTINPQSGVQLLRCKVDNTGTVSTALGIITSGNNQVIECDITQSGASGGVAVSMGGGIIEHCRIKSTSSHGVLCAGAAAFFVNKNTIYECGADGVNVNNVSSIPYIMGNTIVGNTGDGVDIVGAHTSPGLVEGNMITDNGGWGVNLNSSNSLISLGYNRTRDNTSGKYSNSTDWAAATSWGDVTTDTGGQSTDYVSASTDNYALISESPGTSAAFPYESMGAYQRSQTSSVSFGPLSGTLLTHRNAP